MTVVALLTDFGLRDTFVAELKASLLRLGPSDLTLVDVTHRISPGDIAGGRWALQRIWGQWPKGSIVLAVVDPGVGTDRPAVVAAADGCYFVGPGNGLAAFLADRPDLEVVRLDPATAAPPPGLEASTTFHGRDLFAPAAARLAAGAALADLGEPGKVEDLGAPLPVDSDCTVVWVDRFGNVITDLARDSAVGRLLDGGAEITVLDQPVRGPVQAFADAGVDELVWYWGSGGTLEIALDGERAATRLDARPGLVIPLPGT